MISPNICSLFPNGLIYTSEKPYIKGDWENLAIHDTHIRRTKKNYYFKKYAQKIDGAPKNIYNKLYKQMDTICKFIYKEIKGDLAPPDFSQDAFGVYGLDFLVKEDFTVSFLEANVMPSYKSCIGKMSDDYSDFSYEYYLWTYNTAIAPKFGLPFKKN